MEKAIMLLSGGVNSAVAAAGAAEEHQLYPLFVNFHQQALPRELEAFERLCRHFAAKRHWRVDLSHFRQVGGNALVDPKIPIDDASALHGDGTSTFVAGLLPTLLDVAASFAYRIGATRIICGASEDASEPAPGNAALYPDNRREFFMNYQYMIESALPERQQLRISVPLIDYTRAEIVKLGRRLKVPFEATWSCYRGEEAPCGRCYGCAVRTAGFLKAAIPDPLMAAAVAED